MTDWKKVKRIGEKVARIGSDLAEVVVHIQKPSLFGVSVIAARAINSLNDITQKQPDDFFAGWTFLGMGFSGVLLRIAKGASLAHQQDTGDKSRGRVFVGEVHGCQIGWVEYDSWTEGPWTENDADSDKARMALGRLVWEVLGSSVKLEASLAGDVLAPDLLTECHESKTATDLFADIKKFNDRGHTRSILLYGDAGTGKSHIMRHVSLLNGGHSLRIAARNLSNLRDISRAVELLSPSAVLIDDLDRLEHPGRILSEIEEIKGASRLLVASVNDIAKLDPAVLRAGRFDDVIEITKLDDAVLNNLIGDVPPEIDQQLRELPVAWIHEFHRLREVLGLEAAIEKVTTLQARCEEIRKLMKGSEEDDDLPSPPTKS